MNYGQGNSLVEMVDEIALRPSILKGAKMVPSEVAAISRVAASLLSGSDSRCYPTHNKSIVFERKSNEGLFIIEVFSDHIKSAQFWLI